MYLKKAIAVAIAACIATTLAPVSAFAERVDSGFGHRNLSTHKAHSGTKRIHRTSRKHVKAKKHHGIRHSKKYARHVKRRHYVGSRRHYRRHGGYYYGGHRYHKRHHYSHRRHHKGTAVAAGIIGLAAGAIIASEVHKSKKYHAPRVKHVSGTIYEPFTPAWYAACARKYRSFNPETGKYLTYRGVYRMCHL